MPTPLDASQTGDADGRVKRARRGTPVRGAWCNPPDATGGCRIAPARTGLGNPFAYLVREVRTGARCGRDRGRRHLIRRRPGRRGSDVFWAMPQSEVWTSSTSVLALRKTLPGTEPSHLSLRVPSPTLPTTNRSALTSLARRNSACTGSPGIGRASIFFAPATLARSQPPAGSHIWRPSRASCSPPRSQGDLGVGDPGAKVNHTIRPGWSSPASLVHRRQIRHRDDQLRIIFRGERGCVVHRTLRRVRAISADHQGLIGAHFPPFFAGGFGFVVSGPHRPRFSGDCRGRRGL
jgi:hypothetical protein